MECEECGSEEIEVFEYKPDELYGAECKECGALYERKNLNLLERHNQ